MSTRRVVHVVTDRRRVAPDARTEAEALARFEQWLDEVVDAAPDVIQVRERDLEARLLTGIVGRLVGRTAGGATRVVVNDRADVALSAGAAGVHLRADGPPASRVRSIGPPGWLVGRSAHSVAAVRAAANVDYVYLGTLFETASKPGAPAVGLDVVRASVGAVPVIAIGGIDVQRAVAVCAAGARGVAAIGLFLPRTASRDALGPQRAVAALREAMLE